MKFEIGEIVDCGKYNREGEERIVDANTCYHWPLWAPCKVVESAARTRSYLIEDSNRERIWVEEHLIEKMNTPAAAPLPTGGNTGTQAPTGGNVPTTPDMPGDVPQGFIEGIEKLWEHLPEFKTYLAAKEAKRIDSIDRINELRAILNKWEEAVRK